MAESSHRVMALGRHDHCVRCTAALPAGTRAQWDCVAKTVTCLECADPRQLDTAPVESGDPVPRPVAADAVTTGGDGIAGESAQREFEQRRDKRQKRVRDRHPRLGGLILALSDEPQSTTAWAKGAKGERKLGEALDKLRSEQIVVLHDRQLPGSRANIDHIVVAPSGIFVIDAKRYTGKVELRTSGSIFRPGPNLLYVGGRNQTKLVEAMGRQVDAVAGVLAPVVITLDAPIRPALCFVDAEWGLFDKPMTLQGVRISGPKSLATTIRNPGPLMPEQVHEIASQLRAGLRSAGS